MGRSSLRAPVLATLASLAIRLLLLFVVGLELEPISDEQGYLDRGNAWQQLFAAVAHGQRPDGATLDAIYGEGIWPPVHPFLLGLWGSLSGGSRLGMRLLMLALSTATTPMVYLLARRLAGRRSAVAAAWLHAIYPSFVVFSYLFWSETTYLLLLVALAWSLVVCARRQRFDRRAKLGWALCGLLLALTVLTKASAVFYLVAVPAWVLWRQRRSGRPLAAAALVVAGAALPMAAWSGVLLHREVRLPLVSTRAGTNLLLGNSPWQGERWRVMAPKIAHRARLDGVSEDQAARRIATEEIAGDPRGFVARSWQRLRVTLRADQYLLRQSFTLAHGPLGSTGLTVALLLAFLAPLVLTTLFAAGIAVRSPPADFGLLYVLLVAVALPPLVSYTESRMLLPLAVLALPVAGHGLVNLAGLGRRARLGVAAVALIFALHLLTAARFWGPIEEASAYYHRQLAAYDRILGSSSPTSDCLELRGPRGTRLELRASAGYFFHRSDRPTLAVTLRHAPVRVDVYSPRPATAPPRLRLRAIATGETGDLRPLAAERLGVWQSSDLRGVELRWCGLGLLLPAGPRLRALQPIDRAAAAAAVPWKR